MATTAWAWSISAAQIIGPVDQPAPEVDRQKANTPLADIAGVPVAESLPSSRPEGPSELSDEARRRLEGHCRAAAELVERGQFDRAVSELDAALQVASEPSFEALYLLARAKLGLGRQGEARLAAEQAVRCRPASADAHLLLGRLYKEQGNLEGAIAHLRTATLASQWEADNPHVTLAWYELGQCLAEGGYLRAAAQALECFDQALWDQHPEHQENPELAAFLKLHPLGALECRLQLLRQLDRPTEQTQVVERALQRRPNEPYLRRLYARTLVEVGRAGEAFDFCRRELLAEKTSPAVEVPGGGLLWLAIEAGQLSGRLEGWISELAADASQGRQVDLATSVARRLDEVGQHRLSVLLWRVLAEAEKPGTDPAATWALATALKDSGDLRGALGTLIEFVRRAAGSAGQTQPAPVDISPARLAAWMRSFAVSDEFLRLVNELTAEEDCDFATYAVLGMTAAAADQTELAERLFTSALERRPDLALVHLAWGRMALASWQWQEALTHAQQALAVAPDLPAAYFLQAEAYEGLDQHAQAEAAYKAALDKRPGEVTYLLALARHYRRVDNLLAAQRYLQQAWSLDCSLGEALEELVDSYLAGGKTEVARACLKQAEACDVPEDSLRRVRTMLRFADAPMQPEHLAELARQLDQHPEDVATGLKLATGLYLSQRADEAWQVLQRLQERAPEDDRLVYLLARVQLRRLEPEQAVALMEKMVRRYPRRVPALRLLADSYLTEFRIEEARQTLQRLLSLDLSPEQRQQVSAGLLATYLELSEFDQALELVDGWMAAQPDQDVWARAKLEVLLEAKRQGEAVALAAARLEVPTRRLDELRAKISALAERLRQRPEDADLQAQFQNLERELRRCMTDELYPRRSEYVQVCLEAEHYGTAERQVRAWLAEEPQQRRLQEWLIELLLAGGKSEEALEAVGRLAPESPADMIRVLVWRARALALGGKLEEGLQELTSLLEEGYIRDSPAARAEVQREVARLLVEAREFDRALALCDDWLMQVPKTDQVARAELLQLKRQVASAADRLDQQVAVMEELLELQPYEPGLNNDLGYTWADQGRHLDRATQMIKLAVASEPLNAAFLDSLGWVYYKQADFHAAHLYLSRAVRLRGGQDPVVYDHLGDAACRLGDLRGAAQHWQTALERLDQKRREQDVLSDARLLASLRAKLSALERGQPPAVAPTAAEQPSGPRQSGPSGRTGPAEAQQVENLQTKADPP